MPSPAVDSIAPAFELKDQHGELVSLENLAGKWVVLYFYPKDDTPGCTKEACNFRDNHAALHALGAVVLGVSADSAAAHAKFAAKYELPFQLLVDDTDHTVARAYGAYGPKSMYGRSYEGVYRMTVVINPGGQIAKAWPTVKPARHGEEVLAWLQAATTS